MKVSAQLAKRLCVSLSLLCTLAIACALFLLPVISDPIEFHTALMNHFHEAMFSRPEPLGDGLVAYNYGDNLRQYQHHRDCLVRLGALSRIHASFAHIHDDTSESRHLSRLLLQADQVDWGGPPCVDAQWHTGENLELTVWCEPGFASDWQRFIKLRDTPKYREVFMD
jgi:hypothetical protein